jgi:nucleotide-binding universal stress UspA family protein
MFKRMMVPVDLAHAGQLEKSLQVAADLSKFYKVPICYVGVACEEPSAVAHTPAEHEDRLREFAKQQVAKHAVDATSKSFIGHDPVADVDDVLLRAVTTMGADVVVMASHIPTLADYIWPSNGGKIAAHAAASVFIVR